MHSYVTVLWHLVIMFINWLSFEKAREIIVKIITIAANEKAAYFISQQVQMRT